MIPSCKRYLKKCDEFSLCVRCGDADFVACEHPSSRFTQYHYGIYGSGTFGVMFKEFGLDFKSDGKLYDMRDYLHEYTIYKADSDFYMIGFNCLNKHDEWDARLVTESFENDKESTYLVCLDGSPIVNGKTLRRFDYSKLEFKDYDVTINDGVIGVFTKTKGALV